jgi:hypothetical protein
LGKTKIVHSRGFNALNMQKKIWFVSSVENVNFAINGKYFPKTLWQSKPLCFRCDLSNIQKCNFKECPLTWVALLIVTYFLIKMVVIFLIWMIKTRS